MDYDDEVDVIDGKKFIRSERIGCYLCGAHLPSRKIGVAFGMHAMVAECKKCRIAYQSPRPSPDASLAYMNWRWRSADAYVGNPKNQLRRAVQQISYVKRFVSGPCRLLDFGAGAGSFVRAALDEGWDAKGVEQSDSARERAKKFYDVDLFTELDEEKYDVVTMWDVVEHLRDPRSVLSMLGEHLADNGLLFLETGNYENWRRVVEKDNWGLYLFDHHFYFSPSSLRKVLRDSGYNGFYLMTCDRTLPASDPRRIFGDFANSILQWLSWARARMKWPAHGDINVMVLVACKQTNRLQPFR